jgi:hypothetical protein
MDKITFFNFISDDDTFHPIDLKRLKKKLNDAVLSFYISIKKG